VGESHRAQRCDRGFNRVKGSDSTSGLATRRYLVVAALVGALGVGVVFFAWVLSDAEPEPEITRIATGLENPRGVAVMPDGRLAVVEAGNGIDTDDRSLETGRVSFLEDLNGDGDYEDPGEIQPIFSQLPSYNTLTEFGTGHDEVGGTGDIVLLDDGRMFITRDDPSVGYAADGSPRGINVVEVSSEHEMVGNLVARNATLNSLAFDPQTGIFYVVESGANRIIAVTMDGTVRTLAAFPTLRSGQQAVPSGVAIDPTTGDLLVVLFSGQIGDGSGGVLSYIPGDSKIVRIDAITGALSDAITGLTTAVDVAIDEHGNLFVVALTNGEPPPPMARDFDLFDPEALPDPGGYSRFAGSVTLYPVGGGEPLMLVDGLDSPTNITYADGALYVSVGQGTPGRPIDGPAGATRIVGEIFRITGIVR
jgi:hypothetical protein